MKPFICLLLFIFLFRDSADSQLPVTFQVKRYGTEDGLPSNGIKGIQWDESTGFLWIATEAGLARFNGIDFKTYTKENTPLISTERMLLIVRNVQGNIYAADQAGNIVTVMTNKLLHFSKISPNNGSVIYCAYGLSVSERFFNYKMKHPDEVVYSWPYKKLVPVTDTSILIIIRNQIYYNRISATKDIQLPTGGHLIKTGFKIAGNCFFVTFENDVLLIDPFTQKQRKVTVLGVPPGLFKSSNSQVFWENGQAFPVLIINNKAWELHYNENNLYAKLITDAVPTDAFIQVVQYSENKKQLFIGTDSKGLIMISQNHVFPIKKNTTAGIERNAYYAQVELSNGNILTNEGHIIGFEKSIPSKLPIQGVFRNLISTTGDSLLWYSQTKPGNADNLYTYNLRSGEKKKYKNSTAIEYVVLEQDFQNIFIANELGIAKLIGDSLHYLYQYPFQVFSNTTYDMLETSPGVLLIATCKGLLQFNTHTSKLDTILAADGYCIRTLWKYEDYIFIGTYGQGFMLYHKGRIKSMPLDKNRYLLFAHCFVPDAEGYCWISTNRGIFKAQLTELLKAFENNSQRVYYHYFGHKDGMTITEMNGGCRPCALVMKNGIVSFPTMDGLLWVEPGVSMTILPEGEIFVDDIRVDGKEQMPESFLNAVLPTRTKEIELHLGFSAWSNIENIYIEYQLNDTVNWKTLDAGRDAVIRLNNLPPGDYRLTIRKRGGFGSDNYAYKRIQFTIKTPFYQQKWFIVLSILLLLAMVIFYIQFRTRLYKLKQRKLEALVDEKTKELQGQNEVLEKNNTIKTRLISIISHDIVTPLKFLTVAGNNIRDKKKELPEELRDETINEMTNTSRELHLLTTNILNWIKYQNENRRMARDTFSLHEAVNQVIGVLNSIANLKKIHIINKVDKELEIYQFFEPVKILVYNLVSNAINFSEKGNILISCEVGNEEVIMHVTDEGVGMTPEQMQNIMSDQIIISSANMDKRKGNGLGYLIIKDLLKIIGGSIEIKSQKWEGSTITLHIPTGKLPLGR